MSDLTTGSNYMDEYTVVSNTPDGVVLRPNEDSGLAMYLEEFSTATGSNSNSSVPTIRLTQVPSDVISVDAYVDYFVEYPRVSIDYGTNSIDISDRVSVNHPNPETPGLYALDFMVSTIGGTYIRVWRSWVSIEEAPLLRRVITPWNRDNKVIADINRLIVEPQFTEALYEAGVPLYNFQQANATQAVSQFASQRYRNARAFVKDGNLFISGPRLPQGTLARVGDKDYQLGAYLVSATFSKYDEYLKGSVVEYCGSDYYAVDDIPRIDIANEDNPSELISSSIIPGVTYGAGNLDAQYWVQGALYVVDDLDEDDGEYSLSYLWASLDVNGYLFKMDLLRAFPVRHYWGHYNSKHFYDYAPGDLVSVVSNNMVSLYQRNETSIDEKGLEESYRPGHYMNPHWTEVYCESNDTEIRDPVIKPYSNASNAIISKTYSAREESFRMYSNLVGIPTELVDLLGAKYSVILWAILYRTRETFPGIKAAFNAIGFDIPDLHREYPSVIYKGSDGSVIGNVYTEITTIQEIAKSVKADRVWVMSNGDTPPIDSNNSGPAWIAYSEDGNSVLKYDASASTWKTFYTFQHVGSDVSEELFDYSVNNRYYRATLNLLDRISKDGALDFGDGTQWISQDYFVALSLALTRLLSYEVPIYIYLKIKVYLASIGHSTVKGVSNVVLYQDAWGGPIGLKVYPGKVFNLATCWTEYHYPTVLYSYQKLTPDSPDSSWQEYIDFTQRNGYRYYPFTQAVYIRMRYPSDDAGFEYKVDTFWTSRYTLGCFGDGESTGTDNYDSGTMAIPYDLFKDASLLGRTSSMTHSPDVYLCKGIAGCTLRISTNNLEIVGECMRWNYIFEDEDWTMDEVLPFASWKQMSDVLILGCWVGDSKSFRDIITQCASPEIPNFKYMWDDTGDDPVLYVGGGVPTRIMLYDNMGRLRGLILVPYLEHMLLDGDDSEYLLRFVIKDVIVHHRLTSNSGNPLTSGDGGKLLGD